MDVALHWHSDWPEYLQPLLSALEGLPEAEQASDGSLLFCPDAGAMAPPKSSDAALVALVPQANAALDPHRAQLLRAALSGWSERGALFATPTMSAALGLRLMLGLSTDRVAVLPLPLPPARVPTCSLPLGSDVL